MGNMEIIKFDCNSRVAPAYSCNKPGDNSGEYYRKEDVDKILKPNEVFELPDGLVTKDAGLAAEEWAEAFQKLEDVLRKLVKEDILDVELFKKLAVLYLG